MKGIEVLKALKIKQAKEQYPVIVEDMKQKPFEDAFESYFGKVLTRYNPNSTNGLTKCIEDYINLLGGLAERTGNQGTAKVNKVKLASGYDKIVSVDYIPSQGRKGTADIHGSFKPKGMRFGVALAIEVKYGKDRMSEAQKKYKKDFEDAGGVYIIAKNFEDFFIEFNEIFNINYLELL